jgi:hypothetical protein
MKLSAERILNMRVRNDPSSSKGFRGERSRQMKLHTAHDGGRMIVRFDPKMGKKRGRPMTMMMSQIWITIQMKMILTRMMRMK